jgi:putative PIN family toxin of toxin-antitoxin system
VRIVLDTNVVMSALLWRGPPYRLLQTIRQQPSRQLYSSPVLLEELTDVITRPGFSERLSRIGKSAREVLADYLDTIELVEPIEIPRIVRDPDDDHVLACALAAKAELIVSGDKDLLVLHEYQGIPILPATAALQHLETKAPGSSAPAS